MSLVEVRDLRVELSGSGIDIVDSISFAIEAGEVLGLVGESGSGKTTIGIALLGDTRRGARIARGEVVIDGTDLLRLSPQKRRLMRGRLVAYIPQDPSAALNPALRIEQQLREMLEVHAPKTSKNGRLARMRAVLSEVKLPHEREFLRQYPHQLSGGQQQRIAIAMAFILHPKVIIFDEPTTGLDVTTQAHVLQTVRELCRTHKVAGLYVSHDLAVISELAHRVAVAYAGRLVELATCTELFEQAVHPYTRRLLAAIPVVSQRRILDPIPGRAPPPGVRPPHCLFAPRCQHAIADCSAQEPPLLEIAPGHVVRCLRARELLSEAPGSGVLGGRSSTTAREEILSVRELDAFYGSHQILHKVSLTLRAHECLALVGESGSGKTTLARSIIGLLPSWKGEIGYNGQLLAPKARARPSAVSREVQYIFQSPYNSLNPRRTVGASVAAPLEHFFGVKGRDARERLGRVLNRVSLPAHYASRYPDELSGGERQRVAIARALACEPKVLICDEITSALDVSVQAAIVRLLEQLQEEQGLAMLFITHNLALVRTIADRVVVMHEGRIVEAGDTNLLLDSPSDPYTRTLLEDTPTPAAFVRSVPQGR